MVLSQPSPIYTPTKFQVLLNISLIVLELRGALFDPRRWSHIDIFGQWKDGLEVNYLAFIHGSIYVVQMEFNQTTELSNRRTGRSIKYKQPLEHAGPNFSFLFQCFLL